MSGRPPPGDYERCGAKRRRIEDRCGLPAGHGTDHPGVGPCKLHGGATRAHRVAAARESVDREVRTYFGHTVELRTVDNPLAEYRQFAGKVLAWYEAMDKVVGEIRSIRVTDEFGGEHLRAEVQAMEHAMTAVDRVLANFGRLKIDERLAAITIEQKRMVIRAIDAALATAGVAGPKAIEARKAAARHLRVVGEGEAA